MSTPETSGNQPQLHADLARLEPGSFTTIQFTEPRTIGNSQFQAGSCRIERRPDGSFRLFQNTALGARTAPLTIANANALYQYNRPPPSPTANAQALAQQHLNATNAVVEHIQPVLILTSQEAIRDIAVGETRPVEVTRSITTERQSLAPGLWQVERTQSGFLFRRGPTGAGVPVTVAQFQASLQPASVNVTPVRPAPTPTPAPADRPNTPVPSPNIPNAQSTERMRVGEKQTIRIERSITTSTLSLAPGVWEVERTQNGFLFRREGGGNAIAVAPTELRASYRPANAPGPVTVIPQAERRNQNHRFLQNREVTPPPIALQREGLRVYYQGVEYRMRSNLGGTQQLYATNERPGEWSLERTDKVPTQNGIGFHTNGPDLHWSEVNPAAVERAGVFSSPTPAPERPNVASMGQLLDLHLPVGEQATLHLAEAHMYGDARLNGTLTVHRSPQSFMFTNDRGFTVAVIPLQDVCRFAGVELHDHVASIPTVDPSQVATMPERRQAVISLPRETTINGVRLEAGTWKISRTGDHFVLERGPNRTVLSSGQMNQVLVGSGSMPAPAPSGGLLARLFGGGTPTPTAEAPAPISDHGPNHVTEISLRAQLNEKAASRANISARYDNIRIGDLHYVFEGGHMFVCPVEATGNPPWHITADERGSVRVHGTMPESVRATVVERVTQNVADLSSPRAINAPDSRLHTLLGVTPAEVQATRRPTAGVSAGSTPAPVPTGPLRTVGSAVEQRTGSTPQTLERQLREAIAHGITEHHSATHPLYQLTEAQYQHLSPAEREATRQAVAEHNTRTGPNHVPIHPISHLPVEHQAAAARANLGHFTLALERVRRR